MIRQFCDLVLGCCKAALGKENRRRAASTAGENTAPEVLECRQLPAVPPVPVAGTWNYSSSALQNLVIVVYFEQNVKKISGFVSTVIPDGMNAAAAGEHFLLLKGYVKGALVRFHAKSPSSPHKLFHESGPSSPNVKAAMKGQVFEPGDKMIANFKFKAPGLPRAWTEFEGELV